MIDLIARATRLASDLEQDGAGTPGIVSIGKVTAREVASVLRALISQLDTATLARQLAEARANAIEARHAARDQVRLRIAALLGMEGEPSPAAIEARVREVVEELAVLRGER